MDRSASDANHGKQEIRQELIATGHVDVMMAIGTNFFYTRSLPCTLCFLDRGKPAARLDTVVMLDARHIYRVISRKLRDFCDEQLQNLSAIVWLYRGETARFLALVARLPDRNQAPRHPIWSGDHRAGCPVEPPDRLYPQPRNRSH